METLKQQLLTAFKNSEYISEYVDYKYFLNNLDNDDLEQLREDFTENYIWTTDIIYYSRAIEFLRNEDPWFQETFELMDEMWYWENLDKLNSEIMATTLLQARLTEEFDEIIGDLETDD